MKRSRTIFVARLLLRAIVLSVLGLCGGLGAPDQARAQAFVCDSADAGESGEFASAGGGGSNFACGTNAIASGESSANTSIGLGFNISAGNDSRNLAVGFGVIVFTILITGFYVRRANSEFDRLTREIVEEAGK